MKKFNTTRKAQLVKLFELLEQCSILDQTSGAISLLPNIIKISKELSYGDYNDTEKCFKSYLIEIANEEIV